MAIFTSRYLLLLHIKPPRAEPLEIRVNGKLLAHTPLLPDDPPHAPETHAVIGALGHNAPLRGVHPYIVRLDDPDVTTAIQAHQPLDIWTNGQFARINLKETI